MLQGFYHKQGGKGMIGRQTEQADFIETMMSRKRIKESFLDKVDEVINWKRIRRRVEATYSESGTGRPCEDVIVLLKGLLLAQWYGLSDPELEVAISDRISFTRFLGLSLQEDVPDETTFCRFRNRLKEAGLSEWIFGELNRQLSQQGVLIKRGSLIDATMVEASVNAPTRKEREAGGEPTDPDATWATKGKTTIYGYKAHAATDPKSGLIQNMEMTTASVHDTHVFEDILPEGVEYVLADKGYCKQARKQKLRKAGIFCGVMDKAYRNTPLSQKQKRRNFILSKMRCGVERLFAHLKARYKYWQVRYIGLKANRSHLFLLGFAYNLKRSLTLKVVT